MKRREFLVGASAAVAAALPQATSAQSDAGEGG